MILNETFQAIRPESYPADEEVFEESTPAKKTLVEGTRGGGTNMVKMLRRSQLTIPCVSI